MSSPEAAADASNSLEQTPSTQVAAPGLGDLVRFFWEPAAYRRKVYARGTGFGLFLWPHLFLFLARDTEFLINRILLVTERPLNVLQILLTTFVQSAWRPGLVLFVTGVALYFIRRRLERAPRLDVFGSASLTAPYYAATVLGHFALSAVRLESVPGLHSSILYASLAACLFFETRAQNSDAPAPASPAQARWMLLGLGAIVFAAGLQIGQRVSKNWSQLMPVREADALPDFSLESLDGTAALTKSSLHGSPAVFDFWATWCTPCVQSMPGMLALEEEFADQGVRFVSVNTEPHDPQHVRAFIDAQEWKLDPWVDTGRLQRDLQVTMLPTIVLATPDGRVHRIFEGAVSKGGLRRAIRQLLEVQNPDKHHRAPEPLP